LKGFEERREEWFGAEATGKDTVSYLKTKKEEIVQRKKTKNYILVKRVKNIGNLTQKIYFFETRFDNRTLFGLF
jgi:hypothetical protein